MSLRSSSSRYCLVAIALGSASFLALSRCDVVDVADRGDLHAGNLDQGRHQVLAPPAGAEASHRKRVVGGVTASRFERRQGAGGRPGNPDLLEEGTAGGRGVSHGVLPGMEEECSSRSLAVKKPSDNQECLIGIFGAWM